MTRRNKRKTASQKRQESITYLLKWTMPRLREKKSQFAAYLVEQIFREKTEPTDLGRKRRSQDNFMEFMMSLPEESFVKIYTGILDFIEETNTANNVMGGK